MKDWLRRSALFRWYIILARSHKQFFRFRLVSWFSELMRFNRELKFHQSDAGTVARNIDLRPELTDRTDNTPVDHFYIYQNNWAFDRIVSQKPERHLDIGSQLSFVSLLSINVPLVFCDIRPVDLLINNFEFIRADVLALPFPANSFQSISSLCVLEHIGLGRYGDKLQHDGTELAVKEILRVASPGASIYVSLPVDSMSKLYFNAHRAFTRESILEMFKGAELKEESYIYGYDILPNYSADKGFGIGMFMFRKD